MDDKEIQYNEKRNRRDFYSSHVSVSKRERLPYLFFGILFTSGVVIMALSQIFHFGNPIPWPLLAMGYPALLIFGIIGFYNYFTLVNLKVYSNGILLPEKPFFGDEEFVPFEEIGKVVVIKDLNDIYPNYAKKPFDYLIYLTKQDKEIDIKKDKEIIDRIKRRDPRIWQLMNYQDVTNLRKFLKVIRGKVEVEIID